MITDTSEVYFPIKRLKDVLPREVFAFSPTGQPYTMIGSNSDFSKFMLMQINFNDCYYPKEEDMEKQVYMLKTVVKITMLENPNIKK